MARINNEDLVKRIARLAKQNQELEEQVKKLEKQNETLAGENEQLKSLRSKAILEKSKLDAFLPFPHQSSLANDWFPRFVQLKSRVSHSA